MPKLNVCGASIGVGAYVPNKWVLGIVIKKVAAGAPARKPAAATCAATR